MKSPFLSYPSETEYLLRSVKPLIRKKAAEKEPLFDPVCASYNSKVPTVLPPIPQKPQVRLLHGQQLTFNVKKNSPYCSVTI